MSLSYYRSDELPAWQATKILNGRASNYSTGWTFSLTMTDSAEQVALTKTTGITGARDGVITVAWANNDLDLEPGTYRVVVVSTRVSDSAQHTLEDTLIIQDR